MTEDVEFSTDVLFPERKKYEELGPKDCRWPEEQPVTVIQFQGPTNHDGEAISVAIPIFPSDTEADMMTRFHVFTKIRDFRMRENNRALQISQEIVQTEKEKRQRAEKEKQTMEKQLKAAVRRGDLKPAEVQV